MGSWGQPMEGIAMIRFAALALAGALGIAAIGNPKPAEAGVVVGVGIGLPVVAYPPAVGVYPYYYGRPYFYRPGFIRYGYGFRGYGFRGSGFRGYGFRGGARGRWR
jgi:hypothetical protein